MNSHANSQLPTLGPLACKHIERLILLPILRQKQLKPFHPLVIGVPRRIVAKDITCLRDLEKTLIFLAPVSAIQKFDIKTYTYHIVGHLKKFSFSKSSYLSFCEFSIQCIHTTVGYLNEHDQRRPSDAPYTNGYFLDLVEQIRQYAAMMSASRERQGTRPRSSSGDDALDYSSYVKLIDPKVGWPCSPFYSDEELTIEGGLSHTGRPVELVRKKKGQAISLTTGKPYEEKPTSIMPPMKRSLSMESCDDSAMRSMARRKKNVPPLDIRKKCKDCDKIFKRPCDLT